MQLGVTSRAMHYKKKNLCESFWGVSGVRVGWSLQDLDSIEVGVGDTAVPDGEDWVADDHDEGGVVGRGRVASRIQVVNGTVWRVESLWSWN